MLQLRTARLRDKSASTEPKRCACCRSVSFHRGAIARHASTARELSRRFALQRVHAPAAESISNYETGFTKARTRMSNQCQRQPTQTRPRGGWYMLPPRGGLHWTALNARRPGMDKSSAGPPSSNAIRLNRNCVVSIRVARGSGRQQLRVSPLKATTPPRNGDSAAYAVPVLRAQLQHRCNRSCKTLNNYP